MATTRKVIIIGSGPAGYTAAIYAARANLSPVMFTGVQAGGQLMLTTLVENYPGFVDGIDGPPLMETFQKQAERFGTEMIADDVTEVDFRRRPFTVTAGDVTMRGAYRHHRHRRLRQAASACPTSPSSWGAGCPPAPPATASSSRTRTSWWWAAGTPPWRRRSTCRGSAARSRSCTGATALRASKIMQERALKNPKISFTLEHAWWRTCSIPPQGKVTGGAAAEPQDRRPVGDRRWTASSSPSATSRTPRSSRARSTCTRTSTSRWTPGTTQTSVPGVFAAGDVQDFTYRQAVTAAGTGCMAALEAERYLEANHSGH